MLASLSMSARQFARRGRHFFFVCALATVALPVLAGCGEGLVTRPRASAPTDSGQPPGPPAGAAPLDGGPADAEPADALAETAPVPTASVPVKAGASATGQIGNGTVVVPSMSFDQNVTLTLKAVAPPIPGPLDGTAYRIEQAPLMVRSRNPLRFQMALSADQQTVAADLRLAKYMDKQPIGFWVAVTGQTYNDADHTLGADFFNLDEGPIFFGVLRACTDRSMCTSLQACSSRLCQ